MEITATERNEMDEHLSGHSAIARGRQLLPSFRTAMMVTTSLEGTGLHMRPLGLLGDPSIFGGTLWFLADDRSRKVKEIRRDVNVSLVFQNDHDSRYMELTGTASVMVDRQKIRELFTPIMKTWFPEGVDDPHLVLIRVDATTGTFWDSPGGVLQSLAAFTKAVVTGTPGKVGRAGTMDL